MSFPTISIAGDLRNILVLAFFFCKSSISFGSKSTVSLVVTVLFSLMGPLFLVFFGHFRGFGSLFGLVVLTLVLVMTLGDCAAFWLGFFRLIGRFGTHL